MMDILRESLRSLALNKLRTFLSMLGIIFGVMSVITVLSLGEGTKERITSMVSSLGSNMISVYPGRVWGFGGRASQQLSDVLTVADVEMIKDSCPSVAEISPVLQKSMTLQFENINERVTVMAGRPALFSVLNLEIEEGIAFTNDDEQQERKVVVLGEAVANNLFENQDPIGERVYITETVNKQLRKIPFRVIGVTKRTGGMRFLNYDRMVFIPFTTGEARIYGSHGKVSSIMASAQSEKVAEQAYYEIDQVLFSKFKDDQLYRMMSQETILETVSQMSQVMTLLLVAIASVSLLVGGIGIMNIMLVSVTERTREIGIKLALGAPRPRVLMEFLIESILITFIAGLIGIGIGILLARMMEIIGGSVQFQTKMTWNSAIIAFGVSTFIGLFFGIYPANKASKLNPVEALRYE